MNRSELSDFTSSQKLEKLKGFVSMIQWDVKMMSNTIQRRKREL